MATCVVNNLAPRSVGNLRCPRTCDSAPRSAKGCKSIMKKAAWILNRGETSGDDAPNTAPSVEPAECGPMPLIEGLTATPHPRREGTNGTAVYAHTVEMYKQADR